MSLSPCSFLMLLGPCGRSSWPWEMGTSRNIRVISQRTWENTCASLAQCPGACPKPRGQGLGPGAVLILVGHLRVCFPILEPTQRPRTVCERWRESLLEHYGGTPRDDQYVPQCDDLGRFIPLQCHGNSDFCWCVDKDGRELKGTRSKPGTKPACKHGTAYALLCATEDFL